MGSRQARKGLVASQEEDKLGNKDKGHRRGNASAGSAKCPFCGGRKTVMETPHKHLLLLLSGRTVVGSDVKPRRRRKSRDFRGRDAGFRRNPRRSVWSTGCYSARREKSSAMSGHVFPFCYAPHLLGSAL